MDKVKLDASITLEHGFAIQEYNWKSQNKISIYKKSCRRAVIRFSCRNFARKISKLDKQDRQILITFIDTSHVIIKSILKKGVSMQGYSGKHPYIQIIVNHFLPLELWNNLNNAKNKSITFPVSVELDLHDWKDVGLVPSDFLLEVEKESKTLMDRALERGFSISKVSKGREYDVSLTNPNNKHLIIALSSHVAKTKSRGKEKTIQKILMDISKMLPYLDENKETVPVIITRPIEFKNSWSFTTQKYLDFYRGKFGFKFMTTEFKNGWEDDIIGELLKL